MKYLPEKYYEIFLNKNAIKVISTIDPEGTPHVVIKNSLTVDSSGRIVFLELLEASVTNKNMVRSLWFNKKISILVFDGKQSIQVKGTTVKILVAGSVYEEYYQQVQSRCEDDDLAAVYYIDVEEVLDETYGERKKIYENRHPLYMHIDRLAKFK